MQNAVFYRPAGNYTRVNYAAELSQPDVQASMAQRDTSASERCKELGIESITLYRYAGPKGKLRDYGKRVLS